MSDTLFGTTESDLYRWQREAFDDLAKFLDAHAPNTKNPLPALSWLMSTHSSVLAELNRHDTDPSGIRKDPRDVVAAYAAALGVEVTEHRFETSRKTRYVAKGRIGKRIGTDQQPRTGIVVSADVYDADDVEE